MLPFGGHCQGYLFLLAVAWPRVNLAMAWLAAVGSVKNQNNDNQLPGTWWPAVIGSVKKSK